MNIYTPSNPSQIYYIPPHVIPHIGYLSGIPITTDIIPVDLENIDNFIKYCTQPNLDIWPIPSPDLTATDIQLWEQIQHDAYIAKYLDYGQMYTTICQIVAKYWINVDRYTPEQIKMLIER